MKTVFNMLPDAIQAISRKLDDLSLWTFLRGINVWRHSYIYKTHYQLQTKRHFMLSYIMYNSLCLT